MTDKPEIPGSRAEFELIRNTNEHGAEYWSARDLQKLLGYTQWRRFEQAIERAMTACEQSGNVPEHHFAGAGKPIRGGTGALQVVPGHHFTGAGKIVGIGRGRICERDAQ